jgi:integrase
MARPKNSCPPLKFHRPTGQYCVYLNNRRITLGKDSLVAERRRLHLLNAQTDSDATTAVKLPVDPSDLTVGEALQLYHAHAVKRYPDKRVIARIDAAIRACTRHAATLAGAFRGRALREVRRDLVDRKCERTGKPLSRRYINHLIDSIVLAWRWLVAEEFVPAENLARLREMSAELAEHGGGAESQPITAVDDWVVEATLPFCLPGLAAMIRLQQLTGMRPGEIVTMRRSEIATRLDEWVQVAGLDKRVSAMAFDGSMIWLYCPSRHKNLHRKKPRVIAIGGEGQRDLAPLVIGLKPDDLVFRIRRGKPWEVQTYGNAIARAIRRANAKRKEGEKLIPRWSPNQLRKAAAGRADRVLGADGAAAMLGHGASRRALDHYIQEQIEKAVETAAKVG